MPVYARRPTGTVPQIRTQTLIVVQAFTRNEDGDIVPATEPREMPDAARAIARAKELSLEHAGAIAFSRIVNPDEGEFSDPTVLFSRGALPDLDMPVRQDELDSADAAVNEEPEFSDGDGDGGYPWVGIKLTAASDFQGFHRDFLALYRKQPDTDLLAVFTSIEDRRIVILPPAAAALVASELPNYQLGSCPRPPSEALSLELGHSLQLDTSWFELTAEGRQKRLDAVRLTPEEVEGETGYLEEFWGIPRSAAPTEPANAPAPTPTSPRPGQPLGDQQLARVAPGKHNLGTIVPAHL